MASYASPLPVLLRFRRNRSKVMRMHVVGEILPMRLALL